MWRRRKKIKGCEYFLKASRVQHSKKIHISDVLSVLRVQAGDAKEDKTQKPLVEKTPSTPGPDCEKAFIIVTTWNTKTLNRGLKTTSAHRHPWSGGKHNRLVNPGIVKVNPRLVTPPWWVPRPGEQLHHSLHLYHVFICQIARFRKETRRLTEIVSKGTSNWILKKSTMS